MINISKSKNHDIEFDKGHYKCEKQYGRSIYLDAVIIT